VKRYALQAPSDLRTDSADSTQKRTILSASQQERFTLAQVKAALDASADNVNEAALLLGCNRATVYNYIGRYPELQEHRKDIVATMNDFAESTVKQRVCAREWAGTKTWLETHHPAYSPACVKTRCWI
jgi:hypothetical protein